MFDSLSAKFASAFSSLRSKGRIKDGDLDEILAEIKSALLDSDVSLSVAESFISRVDSRARVALPDLNKSTNPSQAIFEIVNSELIEILGGTACRCFSLSCVYSFWNDDMRLLYCGIIVSCQRKVIVILFWGEYLI